MKTSLFLTALGLLAFVIFQPAMAFNKDNCGRLFPKADGEHPPYYSPMYVSTMVPSTTSYFSSFGPCSMYADSIGARASYIEHMLPALQMDASRGQGEAVNAYAELSGCPESAYPTVGQVLQQDFALLFASPLKQPQDVVTKIDSALRKHPRLKGVCFSI